VASIKVHPNASVPLTELGGSSRPPPGVPF
jgi:hypothetical protein